MLNNINSTLTGIKIKKMIIKNPNQFSLYAKDFGISSLNLYYENKRLENSMTPYILEERQLNVTQMDVFSRLMAERILWLSGEVNGGVSTIAQAQLMFLDSIDNNDITIHIDTPGGCVKSGLSIVDVMNYIHSDKRTINTGMAASMGAVLLGAGTKGKRGVLSFSKTMLHQSSGGFRGNIQDAAIDMKEWVKTNDLLCGELAKYCDKTIEQIKEDSSRDLWLSANEAVDYGIVDEVILKKK